MTRDQSYGAFWFLLRILGGLGALAVKLFNLLFSDHWSLVTGHWSLATGHRVDSIRDSPFPIRHEPGPIAEVTLDARLFILSAIGHSLAFSDGRLIRRLRRVR